MEKNVEKIKIFFSSNKKYQLRLETEIVTLYCTENVFAIILAKNLIYSRS